jgi:hypothetical protein
MRTTRKSAWTGLAFAAVVLLAATGSLRADVKNARVGVNGAT